MPRQRLVPGDHGKITEKRADGRWTAAVYVRDADGRRRRVERSSCRSAEDARRELQRHLKNRRAPLTGQTVTERTTLGLEVPRRRPVGRTEDRRTPHESCERSSSINVCEVDGEAITDNPERHVRACGTARCHRDQSATRNKAGKDKASLPQGAYARGVQTRSNLGADLHAWPQRRRSEEAWASSRHDAAGVCRVVGSNRRSRK